MPKKQDQDQLKQQLLPDDVLITREAQTETIFDHHEDAARVTRIEGDEKMVIPLAAETFTVEKQETVTGVVRIHKSVVEHEETIDTPTFSETVEVQHVPRGEWVDSIPSVRYEGQTMIIPVVEEVLVVEKRLRLREELHVTKRRTEDSTPQSVTLRREEISIDREQRDTDASSDV